VIRRGTVIGGGGGVPGLGDHQISDKKGCPFRDSLKILTFWCGLFSLQSAAGGSAFSPI